MKFADKLRELLDAKQFSEADLAKASGLPYGTIHNYRMSRRKPSFAAVVKMAKALGVDCTAFSECEDVVNEEPEDEKPTAKKPASKKGGK